MFKILISVISLYLLWDSSLVYGSQSIKFRSGHNKFNQKYFSNFTLYAFNNSLFVDMWIIKTLVPGFRTNIDFQFRLMNSKNYQSIFSYDVDVCSTVISLKDTLLKKWFRSVAKFGNFMDNCPVYKGHYYLNGWYLDGELIPKYLYTGDYRIKGYGYYGNRGSKKEEMVVDIEVEATIQ